MKKLIAVLILTLTLSTTAFAGDLKPKPRPVMGIWIIVSTIVYPPMIIPSLVMAIQYYEADRKALNSGAETN